MHLTFPLFNELKRPELPPRTTDTKISVNGHTYLQQTHISAPGKQIKNEFNYITQPPPSQHKIQHRTLK